MPRIDINTIDYTRATAFDKSAQTVLVFGSETGVTGLDEKKIKLYISESDFTANHAIATTMEKSNLIACRLLRLGFNVLFVPIAGTDAEAKTKLASLTEDNLKFLKDRSKYNFGFIETCGFLDSDGTESATLKALANIAEARQDCILLVDVSEAKTTASDIYSACTNVPKSRYVATFTPACEFKFTDDDTLKAKDFTLPATFAFLSALGNGLQTSNIWKAFAGFERGEIPFLVKPTIEFGELDCQVFTNDTTKNGGLENSSYSINPIALVSPDTYRVYGNRTMFVNPEGLVASSFLNVATTCITITKELYKASKKLTFEQNSDVLWVNFKAELTPLLDKMVSGQGIEGYRFIKVPTDKRATLKAKLRIIPIEAVEYFDLTLELSDSIATVNVA